MTKSLTLFSATLLVVVGCGSPFVSEKTSEDTQNPPPKPMAQETQDSIPSVNLQTGYFDNVSGVAYQTSSGQTGIVGKDFSYQYIPDDTVTFFIQKKNETIILGEVEAGDVTVYDFVDEIPVIQVLSAEDSDFDSGNGYQIKNQPPAQVAHHPLHWSDQQNLLASNQNDHSLPISFSSNFIASNPTPIQEIDLQELNDEDLQKLSQLYPDVLDPDAVYKNIENLFAQYASEKPSKTLENYMKGGRFKLLLPYSAKVSNLMRYFPKAKDSNGNVIRGYDYEPQIGVGTIDTEAKLYQARAKLYAVINKLQSYERSVSTKRLQTTNSIVETRADYLDQAEKVFDFAEQVGDVMAAAAGGGKSAALKAGGKFALKQSVIFVQDQITQYLFDLIKEKLEKKSEELRMEYAEKNNLTPEEVEELIKKQEQLVTDLIKLLSLPQQIKVSIITRIDNYQLPIQIKNKSLNHAVHAVIRESAKCAVDEVFNMSPDNMKVHYKGFVKKSVNKYVAKVQNGKVYWGTDRRFKYTKDYRSFLKKGLKNIVKRCIEKNRLKMLKYGLKKVGVEDLDKHGHAKMLDDIISTATKISRGCVKNKATCAIEAQARLVLLGGRFANNLGATAASIALTEMAEKQQVLNLGYLEYTRLLTIFEYVFGEDQSEAKVHEFIENYLRLNVPKKTGATTKYYEDLADFAEDYCLPHLRLTQVYATDKWVSNSKACNEKNQTDEYRQDSTALILGNIFMNYYAGHPYIDTVDDFFAKRSIRESIPLPDGFFSLRRHVYDTGKVAFYQHITSLMQTGFFKFKPENEIKLENVVGITGQQDQGNVSVHNFIKFDNLKYLYNDEDASSTLSLKLSSKSLKGGYFKIKEIKILNPQNKTSLDLAYQGNCLNFVQVRPLSSITCELVSSINRPLPHQFYVSVQYFKQLNRESADDYLVTMAKLAPPTLDLQPKSYQAEQDELLIKVHFNNQGYDLSEIEYEFQIVGSMESNFTSSTFQSDTDQLGEGTKVVSSDPSYIIQNPSGNYDVTVTAYDKKTRQQLAAVSRLIRERQAAIQPDLVWTANQPLISTALGKSFKIAPQVKQTKKNHSVDFSKIQHNCFKLGLAKNKFAFYQVLSDPSCAGKEIPISLKVSVGDQTKEVKSNIKIATLSKKAFVYFRPEMDLPADGSSIVQGQTLTKKWGFNNNGGITIKNLRVKSVKTSGIEQGAVSFSKTNWNPGELNEFSLTLKNTKSNQKEFYGRFELEHDSDGDGQYEPLPFRDGRQAYMTYQFNAAQNGIYSVKVFKRYGQTVISLRTKYPVSHNQMSLIISGYDQTQSLRRLKSKTRFEFSKKLADGKYAGLFNLLDQNKQVVGSKSFSFAVGQPQTPVNPPPSQKPSISSMTPQQATQSIGKKFIVKGKGLHQGLKMYLDREANCLSPQMNSDQTQATVFCTPHKSGNVNFYIQDSKGQNISASPYSVRVSAYSAKKPTLLQIAPTHKVADNIGFTLSLHGADFNTQSRIELGLIGGNTGRVKPIYVSSTKLEIKKFPALKKLAGKTLMLRVKNGRKISDWKYLTFAQQASPKPNPPSQPKPTPSNPPNQPKQDIVTITSNPNRNILSSPNGGEVWIYGKTETVRWNQNALGGSYLDIYVLHDDPTVLSNSQVADLSVINSKRWYRFATKIRNTGSYTVDPAKLNSRGDAYLILIVSSSDKTKFDLSDKTFGIFPKLPSLPPSGGGDSTTSKPVFNSGVALSQGNGYINTAWNAAYNATRYELYRSTNSSYWGSRIYSGTGTSYRDTNVSDGTTYYYRAKACNNAGCTDGRQNFFTYRKPSSGSGGGSNPSKPSFNSGVALSQGSGYINTAWNAASNFTRYELYRSTNSSYWGSRIYSGSNNSYRDTNVSDGTTYYYRAKACNSAGCTDGRQNYFTYRKPSSGSGGGSTPTPSAPTLSSLTPDTQKAKGHYFDVYFYGSNFTSSSQVEIDNGRTPSTTYVSSSELKISIQASQNLAGQTLKFRIKNGSQTSGWKTISFLTPTSPTPEVTSISPTTVTEGTSTTFTVTGQHLPSTLAMSLQGSASCGSESVNSAGTQATITCIPKRTGDVAFYVAPQDGGKAVQGSPFTITVKSSKLSLSRLSHTRVSADGSSFNLYFYGSNFTRNAEIEYGRTTSSRRYTYSSPRYLSSSRLGVGFTAAKSLAGKTLQFRVKDGSQTSEWRYLGFTN